mgnify:CR=1 FL=1
MDGNGSLFGTLCGNTREVLHKFTVDLPKKHGRGGQSALRFARLRVEKRHNYVRKVRAGPRGRGVGHRDVAWVVVVVVPCGGACGFQFREGRCLGWWRVGRGVPPAGARRSLQGAIEGWWKECYLRGHRVPVVVSLHNSKNGTVFMYRRPAIASHHHTILNIWH